MAERPIILALTPEARLQSQLEAQGWGLEAGGDAEFDAVLLDLDGLEQPHPRIAELRARHPDVPLLVVSSNSDPRAVVEAIRAGAHDWVTRPVRSGLLKEVLDQALVRRRLSLERRGVVRLLEERGRQVEDERRLLNDRIASMAAELELAHRQLEEAHRELHGRVAQLTMLYRIGRDLTAHRNWDEALASFLRSLCRFLDARGAALLLASDEGRRLAARSVHGMSPRKVERAIEQLGGRARLRAGDSRLVPLEEMGQPEPVPCAERDRPWQHTVLPLCHHHGELGFLLIDKEYAGRPSLENDFYFLITIQTVLTEEVASAQAFSALRRLQRFHERTLDHLSSGILSVDAAGRVLYANAKARELLGGAAAGRPLEQVLRIEGADSALGPWLAAHARSSSVSADGWIRANRERSAIPVSLVASPLPSEVPGETHTVCVLEDQRQRHALEAERRRAARQNELLIMAAEWAHDIRTPLTGILHSAELLSEALPEDSPKRRHFGVVRDEVDRIEGLVSHFLDYARPARLKRVDVDLIAVTTEVVDLLRRPARSRKLELRLEGDLEDALTTFLDRDAFKQVLLNLITNALDASPTGGAVTVRVGLRPTDPDVMGGAGEVSIVEVRDRGPGVADEHIDRLFIPFFTTKPHGTGLGLAISDKIVRAHDGHLRYERVDGTTILRVVLPRAVTPAARDLDVREVSVPELEARG